MEKYEPIKKSVRKHSLPQWFDGAKFGIFIHWGLYSVPAFAITGMDMIRVIQEQGFEGQFKNNPYAEWYLNSLRIEGSPTQEYHRKTYGNDFKYEDFIPIFNERIMNWDPEEMAKTFKEAGAKYVVLGTKHHDGFILWPSKFKHPFKKIYEAKRDIVGELTNAVKKNGMIMGFYYSGTLDWSFTNEPITDLVSFVNNGIISDTYTLYANNHWRELIDKYKPLILWNDIGYPPNTNIFEIFAYFYNKFPDGVINDRWMQLGKRTRKVLKFPPIKTLVTWIVKRSMIKGGSSGLLPAHCDFITPEYASFHKIKKKKWESTRGIGNSFGFNQFETERDYLQSSEVIRMLVDIVSKNGNLLLNIGPMADGTIPDLQKKLLIELGAWLKKFGESIYETNPWIRAESVTSKGIPVRFTSKLDALYVFILNKPEEHRIKIKEVFLDEASEIKDLGTLKAIEWAQDNSDIVINTEEILFDSSAHVFKITPLPS